jgi:putative redox protein
MADDIIRSATVVETGESAYAVAIDVAGYHWTGDEPVSAGGGGLGPNPYDTLLAALGECTAMTVRWYARREDWPLDKVEVSLTHRRDGRTDVFDKVVTLHGATLTEDQHRKLIEIAGKCPVQRTLEGTSIIRTRDGGIGGTA